MSDTSQHREAKVQWWDERSVCVLCPWCDQLHHHGFDRDYSQRHFRVAHCDPIRNGKVRTREYVIKFPLHGPATSVAYEIDKEHFRFVTAGVRLPQEKLDSEEIDRLRRGFQQQICGKLKWTDAVEKLTILEDFTQSRIDVVASKMVLGNLAYVREYLENSSEAHIFISGVKVRKEIRFDLSDSDSDNDNSKDHQDKQKKQKKQKKRTEIHPEEITGLTALHMAACEAHPEIVDLLLSYGAHVDAVDRDGRTPLMEATLWGRLENVEKLLEYGADKTLNCVHDGYLRCAVDFAKPSQENLEVRRWRGGGVYKEDTYARDKDRKDIVRLLEPISDEPRPAQLDTFAFQRHATDRNLLSLTTHYHLPTEWKTIARLCRGSPFPEIAAMSGWSSSPDENVHISGRDWTDEVFELCRHIGHQLPHDYRDGATAGRFSACHAEKQLVAYFVRKHLFLPSELERRPRSVDPDQEVANLLSTLDELALEQVTEQELEQRALDEDERDERARKLQTLRNGAPAEFLKEAVVMVSRPICYDCKGFVAAINAVLGLDIRCHHYCLSAACRDCVR